MSRPIYLSTREVAALNGNRDSLPAIYATIKRKRTYLGIEPRKGDKGRLIWPAEQVFAALRPSYAVEPAGFDLLVNWIRDIAPDVSESASQAIAYALTGSEATPGWKPGPGQFDHSRLKRETAIAGFILQSTVERLDQTSIENDFDCSGESDWLSQITYAKLRPGIDRLKVKRDLQLEGVAV